MNKEVLPEDYRADITKNLKVDWTEVAKVSREDFLEDENSGADLNRVKFYDDNSTVYEEEMVHHKYQGANDVGDATHKYLKGNVAAEILDVGAGSGLISKQMKTHADYRNIDGLDPAKSLLALGQERGLFRNAFVQFFFRDCGLPADRYDAVITSGTFVPGHLKAECLYEFHRVLKPGGLIIIAMRENYLTTNDEFSKMPGIFEEMITKGKWEQLERSAIPQFFIGNKGVLLVFRKIC